MAQAKATTQPPRSRLRALIPTIIIVIALAWFYTVFTGIWTDHLWFDALGFDQVWGTQLLTRVLLAVAFGLVMALVIGVTIWLVARVAAGVKGGTAAAAAYRGVVQKYRRIVVVVPALLFGIFGALNGSGHVMTYLAWANQQPFNQVDARFGLDLSFFVFDYPWYRALTGFGLLTLGLAAAVAAFGHFALGSLAAPSRQGGRASAPGAHRHVAVMLALFFVVYALSKVLDRFGQLLNQGELLTGLNYTGDHAQINANTIMAVVAGLTALLFLFAVVRTGWRLPITSVALMVVTSLIVGLIYPAFVQKFQVDPDKPDKERPYVEMNIAATRTAYGIADVEITDYSATDTVAAGQLKSDAAALPGIRLIDPAMVQQTFEQLQQVRGYYSFAGVLDVDRYIINDKETDVVIAAREMDQAGLESALDWNNIHTVYTHGYGLVAAYGNRRQSDGEPDWIARDIPTVGDLKAEQPRIYFGELTDDYAIVGRGEGQAPIEFDTPGGGDAGGEQYNVWEGTSGVDIGSMFNRLLYATRFASMNLLLSDRVNENSQILYDREPSARVEEVAPWLTVDSDVYPAIVNGRIVWIVDAYTTSANYPNSLMTTVSEAISDARTTGSGVYLGADRINYIRNSVKATVDAYSGEVTLYAWDDADPLLQTWMGVFPGTVQPKSDISSELMAHLRYPSDLFKIQRQVLSRYHMTSAPQWYAQSDLWNIPNDPVKGTGAAGKKEPAYYLSIKWPEVATPTTTIPGDPTPLFSLTTVYTPYNRENLSAYMSVVAEATNPDYGRIRILRMSDTNQIEGPGQAFNSITGNEQVASLLRPYLNQGSSAALYGNLLTIPLGGGLLYVEPIYTQREGVNGSFPVLRYVVVRFGSHIGIAETLQGALDQVFSGDAGAETGEQAVVPGPEPGGTDPGTGTEPGGTGTEPGGTGPSTGEAAAKAALAEAETQFLAADAALTKGDLAAYQAAIKAAEAAVQRAVEAMNG